MAMVFSAFSSFMNSVYVVMEKSHLSLWTAVWGAGANILMNLWMIPRIGIQGAAIATLVSYLMCFGIRAVSARRLIPFRLYPGRLAVSTGLLLLQSALCFWGSPVQPFAQMGAFVLLVTVNHKPIFEMLEQVLRILRRRA